MSKFDEIELASYIAMENVILTVNINDLIKERLPIQIFFFCYMLYHKHLYDMSLYLKECSAFNLEDIEEAISDGWLTMKKPDNFELNNFEVTNNFRTFVERAEPENWIDEWFELFPVGVKSGNYYVKTDKNGSLKKMRRFCSLHKEYTPEVIIGATKNYVEKMKRSGYSYMKLAPYFIEKDGVSMLDGECMNYLNEQIERKEEKNVGFAEHEI